MSWRCTSSLPITPGTRAGERAGPATCWPVGWFSPPRTWCVWTSSRCQPCGVRAESGGLTRARVVCTIVQANGSRVRVSVRAGAVGPTCRSTVITEPAPDAATMPAAAVSVQKTGSATSACAAPSLPVVPLPLGRHCLAVAIATQPRHLVGPPCSGSLDGGAPPPGSRSGAESRPPSGQVAGTGPGKTGHLPTPSSCGSVSGGGAGRIVIGGF